MQQAAAGKEPRDTRITIRVAADGGLIVDPGSGNPCRGTSGNGKDAEAGACKNRKVEWTSDPEDLEWRVEFPGETPFAKGESVFSSGGDRGGKIKGDPKETVYKYDISYRHKGEMKTVDPKIVIFDGF